MKLLPISVLLIAFTTLPVFASEFVVQDGTPADDVTALSPETGDDLSLGECCDCCCPSWTGRVSYVHMWRERTGSDSAVLVASNAATVPSAAPAFLTSQFEFDGESGFDISLINDNCCGEGFEFRYLRLQEFSDNPSVDVGFPTSPATNPFTPFPILFAGPVQLNYDSQIQTFELLRRCGMDNLRINYGFRYVDLNETLSMQDANAPPQVAVFATDNDLYGFQVGVDSLLWGGCCGFQVQSQAKAGIYYNDAKSSAAFDDAGNPFFSAGQASSGEAAFVGDLAIAVSYDVTCNCSLRAGYQLLFVDGVAIAADQVPNTGNLGPPGTVPVNIDSSSLLYHGLNIGFEYRR